MAPIRHMRLLVDNGPAAKKPTTRSRAVLSTNDAGAKRKADGSPSKEAAVKRSALGELTNKCKTQLPVLKKVTAQTKRQPFTKTIQRHTLKENLAPPPAPVAKANKILTRAAVKNILPDQTAQKPKETGKDVANVKIKTRLSNEFEKTDESLYSTALEEISIESARSGPQTRSSTSSSVSYHSSSCSSPDERKPSNITLVAEEMQAKLNLSYQIVPQDINDFDKENWNDIYQVSHYAMDIFNYLKEREDTFEIPDYMGRQICLSVNMRMMLVDWMVEIQESFELNHETLYLGVKLVDTYLSKMTVGKETLQLVGAASMFVASKYDERLPPAIDDFLYICDGAYSRKEFLRMEISVLKICNFDLGIPISYRFLRRYARCAKVAMPVLTLARFILELSLMDYTTVRLRDSKLAAGALYLALQMSKISGWTSTLEFYSGYKLIEFIDIVHILNNSLHKKPREQIMTVRNKYSHKIFFEVAKTPLIKNENLKL